MQTLLHWSSNLTEVTCHKHLQQLVNHADTELLTSLSSAPEVPVTAPAVFARCFGHKKVC